MTSQVLPAAWQEENTMLSKAVISSRLASIDALRGLVIIIMLLDHIRDTYFIHIQLSDPVNVTETSVGLFLVRLLSSLCAPVFIFLTGLSACLYGFQHSKIQLAKFLLSRGLILMLLEVTVINFAWTGQLSPSIVYLQVIWCIGLSMVVMAGLIYLPRPFQWVLALGLIFGHNLLDAIELTTADNLHTLWALLHQRDLIPLSVELSARSSYPLLPWPGVMLFGYLLGPYFKKEITVNKRVSGLLTAAGFILATFVLIRFVNGYGDHPWFTGEHWYISVMSFLSLTKYPPSLLYLLLTLGVGFILLALFERKQNSVFIKVLADFGSAPMFFYIVHLYMIRLAYLAIFKTVGANQGKFFGFDHLAWLWLVFVIALPPLYFLTRWFGQLKQRRKDIAWLKYF